MDGLTMVPDWRERVVYGPGGPSPTVLHEDARVKVVLAGLEPGQALPVHPAPFGVFHFLEGEGWMTVAGERRAVAAGATVFVPDGAPRGVEATSRLAFLAVRVGG